MNYFSLYILLHCNVTSSQLGSLLCTMLSGASLIPSLPIKPISVKVTLIFPNFFPEAFVTDLDCSLVNSNFPRIKAPFPIISSHYIKKSKFFYFIDCCNQDSKFSDFNCTIEDSCYFAFPGPSWTLSFLCKPQHWKITWNF